MGGTGIGRDLVEVASLIIAVSLVSMLVLHASQTSEIIGTTGQAFSGVLATATGQGAGLGLPFA